MGPFVESVTTVRPATVRPATESEVAAAKSEYEATGQCRCEIIYDEPGFLYDIRYCAICGMYLGLV
jgi:hypothetical protein